MILSVGLGITQNSEYYQGGEMARMDLNSFRDLSRTVRNSTIMMDIKKKCTIGRKYLRMDVDEKLH
jgi:hypothetical protein